MSERDIRTNFAALHEIIARRFGPQKKNPTREDQSQTASDDLVGPLLILKIVEGAVIDLNRIANWLEVIGKIEKLKIGIHPSKKEGEENADQSAR